MGMDRQIEKKRWTLKKTVIRAGVSSFAIAIFYLLLFKLNNSSLNVEANRVTILTVEKGPFQEYIPIQGLVMPINRFFLETSEGGRIVKIFMEAGAMVKKGDPILKLDNSDLLLNTMWREADFIQQSNQLRQTRLSMEQYRQQLRLQMNQVENDLAKHQSGYERSKKLYDAHLIAEFDFEKVKLDYESQLRNYEITAESQKKELEYREEQIRSLEDQIKHMDSNMALARQKLEDLVIRAPISGQLTSLNADIGQFAVPGTKLGQIDVLGAFSVRAQIDEHYITRVEQKKLGSFELAGKIYRLIVRKIFPEVNNNRFEVDLDFIGASPPDIRRGQTLHINLELSDLAEAVLLPNGEFWESTGGNWVYVLDKTSKTATKRSIRCGRFNPQFYEVLEGLQPGEKVITSSYESFGDIERLVMK